MIVLSCTPRSFPDMSLEQALARIAWAGFPSVELWLPPAAALPETSSLQAALQAADLAPAAVDAGTLGGENLASALEGAAHVGRCAVIAHGLQCNRVVCDLAIASEPLAREVASQLLGALAAVPVLLCLRNRPTDGPDAWERRLGLAAAQPDRLGLALDPGAAQRAGWDLLREWELLAPFVRHVYVTDAAGLAVAAPGMGQVDWDELAGRLAMSGFSGAASLWLEGPEAFHDPLFAESELKESRFLMENWFHGAVSAD